MIKLCLKQRFVFHPLYDFRTASSQILEFLFACFARSELIKRPSHPTLKHVDNVSSGPILDHVKRDTNIGIMMMMMIHNICMAPYICLKKHSKAHHP